MDPGVSAQSRIEVPQLTPISKTLHPPTRKSARLHELERWCLHPGSGLGLASITREPGVAVAEATSCLERLLALRGDHPVRAALQGAAVGGRVVVGRAGYSWTREGVLRVPFDWDVARR